MRLRAPFRWRHGEGFAARLIAPLERVLKAPKKGGKVGIYNDFSIKLSQSFQ
jgi:hypothetical protein